MPAWMHLPFHKKTKNRTTARVPVPVHIPSAQTGVSIPPPSAVWLFPPLPICTKIRHTLPVSGRFRKSLPQWIPSYTVRIRRPSGFLCRPMSRICERIRSNPPICRRCKTSKTLPACMVPRIDTPHRAQSATAAKSSGSPSSSTAMICGDMERSSIWIPCSFGQLSSTSVRGPRSFCGIPR